MNRLHALKTKEFYFSEKINSLKNDPQFAYIDIKTKSFFDNIL